MPPTGDDFMDAYAYLLYGGGMAAWPGSVKVETEWTDADAYFLDSIGISPEPADE